MRESIHSLLTKEHGDRNERIDHGHVARLDGNNEEQKKLRVAVQEPYGHQQSEDAAKAAEERVGVQKQRRGKSAGDQIEHQSRGRRAQHRSGIEAHHPVGVMKCLEESGKKPQRKQLEERAEDSDVHKAVGEWLPESPVHE